MNKYWRIGTGAITYVTKFKKFVTVNDLRIKDSFLLNEIGQSFIAQLKNGEELEVWNSNSTANQYLIAWEALGFISRVNNLYYIATNFRNMDELIRLSSINMTSKSANDQVDRYKKTLVVNILVAGSLLNQYDIKKKEIYKGAEALDINDVKKSISKYEKEIIKSKEMMKKIKEYYDTKF